MTAAWHRKALVVALIFLLTPIMTNAKVYLVSVGVSDYPGRANDLTLPAKDARTIAWVYSKNSALNYRLLLDENATVSKIKSAMNDVFSMAKENDVVVFFYAGHGYSGGFSVYDGNLSYREIRKAMSRSRCRNKVIFADACHSGKIRTDDTVLHNEEASAKKANVMLFLSSRNDEYSFEAVDMKNGYFTNYLQKGLRGGADSNRNRVITARELFEYVHENVVKLSEGKQHPVMWGVFPDNMPVITWK